jgi:hypothetical protein
LITRHGPVCTGQGCLNVRSLQERILLEQPVGRVSGRQFSRHMLDGNPHPTNDRLAAENRRVPGDALQQFVLGHRLATADCDVIQLSQPQAYLTARAAKRRGFPEACFNRSHGLELRVNAVLPYYYGKADM